jgi:hypothetical protein
MKIFVLALFSLHISALAGTFECEINVKGEKTMFVQAQAVESAGELRKCPLALSYSRIGVAFDSVFSLTSASERTCLYKSDLVLRKANGESKKINSIFCE